MNLSIVPAEAPMNARSNERGTAIVESAIFLLAFFMFLFGVMEAGRFLNIQQVLTNAAREGARFGIAPETAETCPTAGPECLPTSTEIETRVSNYLAAARVTGATIAVDQNATGPIAGTSYTSVIVSFDYGVLTVPLFFNSLEITLQGDALMRNETSP